VQVDKGAATSLGNHAQRAVDQRTSAGSSPVGSPITSAT
jgi:hypothetical protein